MRKVTIRKWVIRTFPSCWKFHFWHFDERCSARVFLHTHIHIISNSCTSFIQCFIVWLFCVLISVSETKNWLMLLGRYNLSKSDNVSKLSNGFRCTIVVNMEKVFTKSRLMDRLLVVYIRRMVVECSKAFSIIAFCWRRYGRLTTLAFCVDSSTSCRSSKSRSNKKRTISSSCTFIFNFDFIVTFVVPESIHCFKSKSKARQSIFVWFKSKLDSLEYHQKYRLVFGCNFIRMDFCSIAGKPMYFIRCSSLTMTTTCCFITAVKRSVAKVVQ